MPLDTRITIGIEAAGMRNDRGEYVPGPTTNYEVWSDSRNAGSQDVEESSGITIREIRTFMVRYFAALATAPINFVSITGADGSTWNVLNRADSNERRRFITIEAIRADVF